MFMCPKAASSSNEGKGGSVDPEELEQEEDRHDDTTAKEEEKDRTTEVHVEGEPEPKDDTSLTASSPTGDATCDIIRSILLTGLWNDSIFEVQQALKALVKILDSKDNAFTGKLATFCQYDGPFAVVGVMRNYYTNGSIQAAGAKVFAIATNTEEFVCESSPLWVNECLEAIVHAMKRFCMREDIQRPGCCVLSRFCSVQENAVYVMNQLDGIKVVADAMKNFPESIRLQQWACWAMYSLSRYEENRKAIIQAGGFGLLAYAAGTFQEEAFRRACQSTMRRLMKLRKAEEEEQSNLTRSKKLLDSSLEVEENCLEASTVASSR